MTRAAQTYGEALYELALEEGLDAELLQQMEMTAGIFRDNPEYPVLLSQPSLPKAERCAALDESFQGRVHPYVLNFLKLLTERGLIRQLPDCAEAYRRHYLQDNGILEAVAVAAVPVPEAQLERLRLRLEEQTGKQVRLRVRIDAAVLGGIRLEMDGVQLDGTVRRRLEQMQALLRDTVL